MTPTLPTPRGGTSETSRSDPPAPPVSAEEPIDPATAIHSGPTPARVVPTPPPDDNDQTMSMGALSARNSPIGVDLTPPSAMSERALPVDLRHVDVGVLDPLIEEPEIGVNEEDALMQLQQQAGLIQAPQQAENQSQVSSVSGVGGSMRMDTSRAQSLMPGRSTRFGQSTTRGMGSQSNETRATASDAPLAELLADEQAEDSARERAQREDGLSGVSGTMPHSRGSRSVSEGTELEHDVTHHSQHSPPDAELQTSGAEATGKRDPQNAPHLEDPDSEIRSTVTTTSQSSNHRNHPAPSAARETDQGSNASSPPPNTAAMLPPGLNFHRRGQSRPQSAPQSIAPPSAHSHRAEDHRRPMSGSPIGPPADLCDHILVCGAHIDEQLALLVVPLRVHSARAVVVLTDSDPSWWWDDIAHLSAVYYVRGSAQRWKDLAKAGAATARRVVVLGGSGNKSASAKASADSGDDQVEEFLTDSQSIFTTMLLENSFGLARGAGNSSILLGCTTEFINYRNVQFLRSTAEIVEADKKYAQQQRESAEADQERSNSKLEIVSGTDPDGAQGLRIVERAGSSASTSSRSPEPRPRQGRGGVLERALGFDSNPLVADDEMPEANDGVRTAAALRSPGSDGRTAAPALSTGYEWSPRFAAGRVIGAASMTATLVRDFFNPGVINLATMFALGQPYRISHCAVQSECIGKSWLELFEHCVTDMSVIPLGLYRYAARPMSHTQIHN